MLRTAVLSLVFSLFLYEFVTSKDNTSLRNAVERYRTVHTKNGLIRGRLAKDGEYYRFLSIPYAAPPTGKNRYKAPLPPTPWEDILEANRTVICPQNGIGDEDCLVLNVFTPTRLFNAPLPVFFYIHGGSFIMGSGPTEGVQNLIKQNIIVVTINYRLGALGFLCLGIEEASGNAGLKDQVTALKWVRENIHFFGGDPDQVTIAGMSAGGGSVEYLVLSKMAAGLYKRAMLISGVATPVWSVDLKPIETAKNLAEALEYPTRNKSLYRLADFYHTIPADILTVANAQLYENLTDGTFGFVPCVERRLYGIEPFITESPYEILTKEKYNKVPMMVVFSTNEGLNLRSEEYYKLNYKERMESNFIDFVPADLVFDSEEIKHEVARNIKNFYFGNKTVGNDSLKEYLDYFGDSLILNRLLNSVEIHSKNRNTVYLMEFAFRGNMGFYDAFYANIDKAAHGDMIWHGFIKNPIKDSNDQLAADRISKIVGNFVKFGNPIPERTQLLPIAWPPVEPNKINYLLLDNDMEIREEPYWGRKVFWDVLYARFRKPVPNANASFGIY